MLPVSELGNWLEGVIAKDYGGVRKRLAAKAGITDSVFNRGLKKGSYDVDTLLRIARATGKPASEVLGMAGKGHYVPLLEGLYGPPRALPTGDVLDVVQFLESDDPSTAEIRRLIVATARRWRTPAPTHESPDVAQETTTRRAGRRGSRSKKG